MSVYTSPGYLVAADVDVLLTITVDEFNVNLADLAIAAGWNGRRARVLVTIAAGVKIGSDAIDQPALTTGVWPAKTTIHITNLGKIQGKGGGGAATNSPQYSSKHRGGVAEGGGTALVALVPVTLDNTDGEIWGGGGGGASRRGNNGYRYDGAGGGGAGLTAGLGGSGSRFIHGNGWGGGHSGDDGTETAGGSGGAAANDAGPGGRIRGGNGGDPGEAGGDASSVSGGDAGAALVGSELVTITGEGDILGPQQETPA